MPQAGEAAYIAPHVERHSRLTTFFRSLLVIPHWVLLFFFGIVAYVAVFIAWFAVVITGRYPRPLYDFNANFIRYASRVGAYMALLSDVYPPFGDRPYPVELALGPPKEKYSRLSAFFRFFPLIIVSFIQGVLGFFLYIVLFISWVTIIVIGRLPLGLHDAIAFCMSYLSRSSAYALLLTERFPGFSSEPAAPVAPPVAGGYGV